MPHDPVETIRSYQAAVAARDTARLAALMHPDIVWFSAENFLYADHSPYRGIDAVVGLLFGRLLAEWDDFSTSADEILGGGDIVILTGRLRGVFKANGATVDAQFVQVFQFRDGLIVKCQVFTDTAQFKDAVSQIRQAGA